MTEKVKRILAAPTVEGVLAMVKAITGREPTPEDVERVKNKFEVAEAAYQANKKPQ